MRLSKKLSSVLDGYLNMVLFYAKRVVEEPDDMENLHKFRVYIRRIRSIIKEFKEYFDPLWAKECDTVLKGFFKRTNEARDIDVFLYNYPSYVKRLPPSMKPAVEPIYDILYEKRESVYAELMGFLKGGDFISSLNSLYGPRFVKDDKFKKAFRAAVRRRLKAIRRFLKNLSIDSDAELYHKLRIQFKRLRYIMELKNDRKKIERLKRIQDLLGMHQDLEVQRENLKHFIQEYDFPLESCLAVGKLSGDMEQKELKIRKKFLKSYHDAGSIL